MKKYLFLLSLSIIMMSQKCDDSTTTTSGEGDFIAIQTSGCYGKCPVYGFKIMEDGSATFKGERFTVVEGVKEKKFTKKETESLFNSFEANDFWSFKDEYDGNVSDLPAIHLAHSKNGEVKKIKLRYEIPDRLIGLSKLVQSYANSEGWVKERRK